MSEYPVTECDRCHTTTKDQTRARSWARIRFISRDGSLLTLHHLCPSCKADFDAWMADTPKMVEPCTHPNVIERPSYCSNCGKDVY